MFVVSSGALCWAGLGSDEWEYSFPCQQTVKRTNKHRTEHTLTSLTHALVISDLETHKIKSIEGFKLSNWSFNGLTNQIMFNWLTRSITVSYWLTLLKSLSSSTFFTWKANTELIGSDFTRAEMLNDAKYPDILGLKKQSRGFLY